MPKDINPFAVLNNPSVSYFTKYIIYKGLKKDPVDAVSDVELALKVLKEVMNERLSATEQLDKFQKLWQSLVLPGYIGNPPTVANPSVPANKPPTHD